MTTLENKIFTLKQNHLIKKMKEMHFLNNLISDSEKIIPYPLSCEIINRTFIPYRNIELSKENFSLSIKNELLNFLASEENDIAYVYFYGGINDSAETPIELFPLFIIKIKNNSYSIFKIEGKFSSFSNNSFMITTFKLYKAKECFCWNSLFICVHSNRNR